MDLTGVRRTVSDQVRDELKPRSCEPFGGTASAELVKAAAAKAPAIRIGVTGIRPIEIDGRGRTVTDLQWIALIVTTAGNAEVRDDEALDMTTAFIKLLGFQRWGLSDDARSIKPDQMAARNLYSGPLKGSDAAIWRIDWQQIFTLDL